VIDVELGPLLPQNLCISLKLSIWSTKLIFPKVLLHDFIIQVYLSQTWRLRITIMIILINKERK